MEKKDEQKSSHSNSQPVQLKSKGKTKDVYVVNKHEFEIDNRYEITNIVGTGAYGMVCGAKLKKNSKKCAIKKISKLFEDIVDGKRILREILLLRFFKHPNLLGIKDICEIEDEKNFNEIYIITELLDTDLYRVIKSNQPLSCDHRKFFLYQIVRGLKFIHSANVIHRDLKPSNILLNVDCNVKICDFGLARGMSNDDKNVGMTEYVVTRWYRAPEILLLSKEYDSAIDIWSVGCIMGELINRKALFAGENYADQIKQIMKAIGKPLPEDMKHISNKDCVDFLKNLPLPTLDRKQQEITLKKMCPNATEEEIDILANCLHFNPSKRPSAKDLLNHPYFAKHHKEENETVSDKLFQFEFDNKDITKQQLRSSLYSQMLHFHPKLNNNNNNNNNYNNNNNNNNNNSFNNSSFNKSNNSFSESSNNSMSDD